MAHSMNFRRSQHLFTRTANKVCKLNRDIYDFRGGISL